MILGHTVCSAFSGSITGTFAGNAWNTAYVPGGSSQGSGVAPVARLAAACIGEETGGSHHDAVRRRTAPAASSRRSAPARSPG